MEFLQSTPFYKAYNFLNYELQDIKAVGVPLLEAPLTVLAMLIIYNMFCLKWGPKMMEKRPPYDLKWLIVIFDLFQIVVNAYLFYQTMSLGWGWNGRYNFFCAVCDHDDTPIARDIASMVYLYFLVKVSDVLDTIFMVLRKKNSHISFLHMYHHTAMIITTWIGSKYYPGGHHTCLGIYNTLVHTVMYAYYLMAALRPTMNLTSFKKLVTQMQMFQFLCIFLHMSVTLLVPSCGYTKWILFFFIPNNFMMFLLFYDFYRKAYVLKRTPSKKQ